MVSKSITKKKTNETVKRKLLNSFHANDDVEKQRLNKTENNVNNSQKVILIIYCYRDIIETQNKKEIGYSGKQGQLLKKFKDTENFFDNVGQGRLAIYFKISLYKFLKKYLCLKNPP